MSKGGGSLIWRVQASTIFLPISAKRRFEKTEGGGEAGCPNFRVKLLFTLQMHMMKHNLLSDLARWRSQLVCSFSLACFILYAVMYCVVHILQAIVSNFLASNNLGDRIVILHCANTILISTLLIEFVSPTSRLPEMFQIMYS